MRQRSGPWILACVTAAAMAVHVYGQAPTPDTSVRAVIDKAKAILIKRRGLDEPAAYALLRSHAMSTNRRIAEVAEAIVTSDALLGDLP